MAAHGNVVDSGVDVRRKNSTRTVAATHAATRGLLPTSKPAAISSSTGLPNHFFGYAEQRELELMVSAGMTPAQVIVAATRVEIDRAALRGALIR